VAARDGIWSWAIAHLQKFRGMVVDFSLQITYLTGLQFLSDSLTKF